MGERKFEMTELTQERLKELLEYNPDTGDFVWRVKKGRANIGDIVKTTEGDGRKAIKIDQKIYRQHRLAWFYTYGRWPKKEIDHINGNPSDNRLSNLREANRQQNTRNKKGHSKLGRFKGVYVDKRLRKWVAMIYVNEKCLYLGSSSSEVECAKLYDDAARKYFGEFARLNFADEALHG